MLLHLFTRPAWSWREARWQVGHVTMPACLWQVTYTLPGDYVQFCTEFAKRHDVDAARNYWIMKPAGSSRGRGIFVFNDIGAVSYTECVIVQRSVCCRPMCALLTLHLPLLQDVCLLHVCQRLHVGVCHQRMHVGVSTFFFLCGTTNGRYIERPLLLDGYKFDLRLYICVTSFNPTEAFIYREGFTRLSSEPYR